MKTTPDPISIATIGTGPIVERAIEAMKRSGLYKLQACYSRDLNKAAAFQKKHGFEQSYDDLEAMLSNPALEAIYIASPNALHYFQAKKALLAGKHVLCEKPLVENSRKAKELFDLAQGRGLILLEAMTTLHSSNFTKLKEALSQAGKIEAVLLRWCNEHPAYADYLQGGLPNLFNPAMQGGALMDLGIYTIHFALGLFGRPVKVLYQAEKGRGGIDLHGTLQLIYPDFVVESRIAIDRPAPFLFEILTEKGSFEIRDGSIGRLNTIAFKEKESEGYKERLISEKPVHHMLEEMLDFARLINKGHKEGDRDYQDWIWQSLCAIELLEQARES